MYAHTVIIYTFPHSLDLIISYTKQAILSVTTFTVSEFLFVHLHRRINISYSIISEQHCKKIMLWLCSPIQLLVITDTAVLTCTVTCLLINKQCSFVFLCLVCQSHWCIHPLWGTASWSITLCVLNLIILTKEHQALCSTMWVSKISKTLCMVTLLILNESQKPGGLLCVIIGHWPRL